MRDLAPASAQLQSLLGLDPPFRDPGVAEFGIDNAVFVFGDQFIELVSPVQPAPLPAACSSGAATAATC